MFRLGCLVLMLLSAADVCNAEDLDEDGLDDALEHQLLQQYAPEYFFNTDEDTRPAGVIWFAQRSELWWLNWPWELLASQAELIGDPSLILRQQHELDGETVYSSYVHTPVETPFAVLLVDEDASGYGEPWCFDSGAPCNVGLYGHVVLSTTVAH
jgi:hypothetical protein